MHEVAAGADPERTFLTHTMTAMSFLRRPV